MLTAAETSSERSWQDSINDVQLVLNCTVNKVTKSSPLELMIGKVASPLNLVHLESDTEINISEIR